LVVRGVGPSGANGQEGVSGVGPFAEGCVDGDEKGQDSKEFCKALDGEDALGTAERVYGGDHLGLWVMSPPRALTLLLALPD
jgi:hypothetical protein